MASPRCQVAGQRTRPGSPACRRHPGTPMCRVQRHQRKGTAQRCQTDRQILPPCRNSCREPCRNRAGTEGWSSAAARTHPSLPQCTPPQRRSSPRGHCRKPGACSRQPSPSEIQKAGPTAGLGSRGRAQPLERAAVVPSSRRRPPKREWLCAETRLYHGVDQGCRCSRRGSHGNCNHG